MSSASLFRQLTAGISFPGGGKAGEAARLGLARPRPLQQPSVEEKIEADEVIKEKVELPVYEEVRILLR